MRERVIGALLSREFYEKNKEYITEKHLADKEPVALYRIIDGYYRNHDTDIATVDNLREMFTVKSRGRVSASSATAYHAFLDAVETSLGDEEVTETLIRDLYIQYSMEEAQQLLTVGDEESGRKAKEILDKVFSGNIMPQDAPVSYVDFTPEYFQQAVADRYKWTFHLPALKEYTRGIGSSVFVIVGGTPNAGKTHFCVSSVFQPGGFLEQGAKVVYFANEEHGAVTALRGLASFSGIDKELLEDTEGAPFRDTLKAFSKYAGSVRVSTEKFVDLIKMESIIANELPDVVIVDMADKVSAMGDFSRDDLRLAHIYLTLRDFAKRYSCAVIATSQGSAEAVGKKFWTAELLAGSKTSKSAEGDLIITIGKENKENDDFIRYANIVKNKLTGVHKTVVYRLNSGMSRILP